MPCLYKTPRGLTPASVGEWMSSLGFSGITQVFSGLFSPNFGNYLLMNLSPSPENCVPLYTTLSSVDNVGEQIRLFCFTRRPLSPKNMLCICNIKLFCITLSMHGPDVLRIYVCGVLYIGAVWISKQSPGVFSALAPGIWCYASGGVIKPK